MRLSQMVMLSESRRAEAPVDELAVEEFLARFGKQLSKEARSLAAALAKYGVYDPESLEELEQREPADAAGKALSRQLKALRKAGEYMYLPQALSAGKVADLLKGGAKLDEYALDLKTRKGQNDAARRYAPKLKAMIRKWHGKSAFDDDELMSIAMSALAYAIKTYNSTEKISMPWALGNEPLTATPGEEKELENAEAEVSKSRGTAFLTFLSRCVDWAVLYEMRRNSRVVRRPGEVVQQNAADGNASANFDMSIDSFGGGDDDSDTDRLAFLGITDTPRGDVELSQEWADFMKVLRKSCSERDLNVFLDVWGIGGHEKKSQTDVAKELGVSQPMVAKILKKVLTAIRSDAKFRRVIGALKDAFLESLLVQNWQMRADLILEAVRADETYTLLSDWARQGEWATEAVRREFTGRDRQLLESVMEGAPASVALAGRADLAIALLDRADVYTAHVDWPDRRLFDEVDMIIGFRG